MLMKKTKIFVYTATPKSKNNVIYRRLLFKICTCITQDAKQY